MSLHGRKAETIVGNRKIITVSYADGGKYYAIAEKRGSIWFTIGDISLTKEQDLDNSMKVYACEHDLREEFGNE